MDWFESWFDSPYYHLLYKNRDEKEAKFFIKKLIKHLNITKGSKIIDIACGKGRHATYLNKKGMNVVGIDLSKESIRIAKANENKTLQFIVHDMRNTFSENTFDIATNLFTSIGYFKKGSDEQKAINAMASNIKNGGLLIIDFMNVKKAIHNLIKHEEKIVEGVPFKIKRKIEKGYIIKEISCSDKGKNHKFQEQVRILTLIEFANLIKKSGLKIIDTFGCYKLKDFNALESDRLILICKK